MVQEKCKYKRTAFFLINKINTYNMKKAEELFEKHWNRATGKPLDDLIKQRMKYCIEAIDEALSISQQTDNMDNNEKEIVLEKLSDKELLAIVEELQKQYLEDDSIVRVLAKQFYGCDNSTMRMLVPVKVLPVVADRLRFYSSLVRINYDK